MATPCEVRLETDDAELARARGHRPSKPRRAASSRNSAAIAPTASSAASMPAAARAIAVDAETAHLLDFAAQCFADQRRAVRHHVRRVAPRSGGSTARTVCRRAAQIKSLRAAGRLAESDWRTPAITLPAGMEIDLGGLAKEYAVDRALAAARAITAAPALVNFGGDLRVIRPARAAARAGKSRSNPSSGTARRPGMLELARRRARDQRRCAALSAEGRRALRPHPQSAHRLAGRRMRRARSRWRRRPASKRA